MLAKAHKTTLGCVMILFAKKVALKVSCGTGGRSSPLGLQIVPIKKGVIYFHCLFVMICVIQGLFDGKKVKTPKIKTDRIRAYTCIYIRMTKKVT